MAIALFVIFLSLPFAAAAQDPADTMYVAPPGGIRAFDTPSDAGGSITVQWGISPGDTGVASPVLGYEVFRSTSPSGDFDSVMRLPGGANTCVDNSTEDGVEYYYRVRAYSDIGLSQAVTSGAARSSQQWVNRRRANLLVIACILVFAIVYYIYLGAKGRDLYIRKISGLEAVDEAVGRATEMGRPVLFIPGIQDMDNVQRWPA